MIAALKICILLVALHGSQSADWSYTDMAAWNTDFPQCNGMRQSPIRIDQLQTTAKSYSGINFSNYNNIQGVTIKNNGHTAEILFPDNAPKPQISGGPLPSGARYQLANVHFHWGANDSLGAEHVVNNQRYSMEVHVVHYNLKYGSVMEATNHADGLAVIAVFYRGNPTQGLAGLQRVSNSLPAIVEEETTTSIANFQLSSLLSDLKRQSFYTYAGSLTTPPCSEAVTWIIYPNPILVRSNQLAPFRQLRDVNGNPLVNNFRELQERNGRKVYQGRPKTIMPFLPLQLFDTPRIPFLY